MKLQIKPDYETLCSAVADEVFAQLSCKPVSVLVFPTGNTPLGLFKVLVTAHIANRVDFGQAHFVMLDEYADLEASDHRSLSGWLRRELLDPIGIGQDRCHGFEWGMKAIEETIARLGGLDLVILGLGPNGHLGFNEPGSAFNSRARLIDLTPASIRSNSAYWGADDLVPRQGYTLGLGTIAKARSIILMVSGAGKASILRNCTAQKPHTSIPASCLQLLPQAKIYTDVAAVSNALSTQPDSQQSK